MIKKIIITCGKIIFKLRKRINNLLWTRVAKLQCAKIEGIVRVNSKSHFTKNTYLGSNTSFNGMNILGCGKVEIGDNFHSGIGCVILSEIHDYNGTAIPYDHHLIPQPVTIKDNVWLGRDVTILGGVTIGEGAIIQAGSVVVKDIPDLAIAGGHPAAVFSARDENHYYKLKEQKKFS